jgi:DNA-binding NarL/FixJ family response regulator
VIDIVIADHQELFRIGIEGALMRADDVRFVGHAQRPEQLLNILQEVSPHVLLLSKSFQPAVAKINPILERSKTALLLLAENNDKAAYMRQLQARGVVYRSINGQVLVDAMRRVARGELFVQNRSSDKRAERVLHVCDDPAALVFRERLLMSMGYQICTVLALMGTDFFDFALIGDEGSLAQRQSAVRLLNERHPDAPVITLCHDSHEIEGAVL